MERANRQSLYDINLSKWRTSSLSCCVTVFVHIARLQQQWERTQKIFQDNYEMLVRHKIAKRCKMNIMWLAGEWTDACTDKSMQPFPTMKSFHFYILSFFFITFSAGFTYENDFTALLTGWALYSTFFFFVNFLLHLWPFNGVICSCIFLIIIIIVIRILLFFQAKQNRAKERFTRIDFDLTLRKWVSLNEWSAKELHLISVLIMSEKQFKINIELSNFGHIQLEHTSIIGRPFICALIQFDWTIW